MICTWTWVWLAVDGPGGGTQDVSTSKWTGKESQQRLSFNHVHVMKPVLVQKRRRCSASQVADF